MTQYMNNPSPQTTQPLVALYCGSRAGNNPIYQEKAVQLARKLAEQGFGMVYGGASIGLMGLVADTVVQHGGQAVGVIPEFSHGTSMGLRLSMWQYGGQLLLAHPLTGVGKQGYYREVSKLKDDPTQLHMISTAPHPHNEILNLAVEFGVVGIAVGLALFLIPGLLFRSYLTHQDPVLAFAALAGMLVVVCQFVASLFDAYFWIVSQTSFYGMSVVIFASMSIRPIRIEGDVAYVPLTQGYEAVIDAADYRDWVQLVRHEKRQGVLCGDKCTS